MSQSTSPTKKQLEKENEKLQKKLNKKLQKNSDAEFIQKLETARNNGNNVIKIWNESTNEQRRRVLLENSLSKELLNNINQNRTDLGNFIQKLDNLNANMRNEINNVFQEIPGIDNDSEKLKKAWKKHKPFIVRSRDGDSEIKVRKCALNFGAHRCVYHFLPFDKKNLFTTKIVQVEKKSEDEKIEEVVFEKKKEKKDKNVKKNELKQCKQYTKVVGIDLDFYRNVDPESLVANTIEAAIENKNIIDTKGRQYFCDKHLKQLVGLVPRQIDGDSLAYHLIATQPFYKDDYVATFSQIKVSDEVDLQSGLRISPVSYLKKSDIPDNIGTLDDTCFKDLGDYITDPNADNVFDIYLNKKKQEITDEELENSFDCFEGKCNVEIVVNDKNKICLKAIRTIYKNEIIYLNFGIDYWREYLKFNSKQKYEPAIKSDLRYYKNLASYKTLKSNIEEIKNKYVDMLLMDTTDISYFPKKEENNGNTAVDSVPKKKLSLNRLNNLYKHHYQFNKQTK